MQQFQTFLSFLVLQHVFADVSEEEGKAFNFHEKQHKKTSWLRRSFECFLPTSTSAAICTFQTFQAEDGRIESSM